MSECTGAFGSGGAGATPFGSGTLLAVAEARETSLNSVLVEFTVAPSAADPATAWDALNPANWTVEPLSPPGIVVRLAQWVRRASETAVEVFFDGPLDAPATYRIVAANIRSASGVSISLDGACRGAEFDTFVLYRVPPDRARPDVRADFANPQTLGDEKVTNPLGTFQINDRGDYGLETGRAYLRKRIFRRASSALGSFFHLPEYGFEPRLKGTIKPSMLRALQARAQAQIAREPDVRSVQVSAFTLPDHPEIVVLDIRVEDTNGQAEQMTVPVPFGG